MTIDVYDKKRVLLVDVTIRGRLVRNQFEFGPRSSGDGLICLKRVLGIVAWRFA